MKKILSTLVILSLFVMLPEAKSKNLPKVKLLPDKPLLNLLEKRQSIRKFNTKELSLEQISLILWAAGGKKIDTVSSASRSVPSAGACYPLDIYIYVWKGDVKGLKKGLYRYETKSHSLTRLLEKVDKQKLVASCWSQVFIAESPVVIIVTAQFQKSTSRYGKRGERYVYLDSGHVGENIYLMATQLKLATVEVGAFDDFELANCLGLPKTSKPILIMPIGYAR